MDIRHNVHSKICPSGRQSPIAKSDIATRHSRRNSTHSREVHPVYCNCQYFLQYGRVRNPNSMGNRFDGLRGWGEKESPSTKHINSSTKRAPNPPEFAQPRLRPNGGHPQQEGTNLGVFVPIWPVLRRCEATNSGVLDLCHFALISPYSNGAVQIRVGLELADSRDCFGIFRGFCLWAFPFAKRRWAKINQKTTKDPEIKGSRSQQRLVTDHPPLSECTKTQ